jgi:hypothetical protein
MKCDQETAEKLCQQSDYICQAQNFARYAYEEFIKPDTSNRAMILCCTDDNVSEGTGVLAVVLGGGKMAAHAAKVLLENEQTGEVFSQARPAEKPRVDHSIEIEYNESLVRKLDISAVCNALWLWVVAALAVSGIVPLVTTLSNVLLIGIVFMLILHERKMRMRKIDALKADGVEDLRRKVRENIGRIEELMAFLRNQTDCPDRDAGD